MPWATSYKRRATLAELQERKRAGQREEYARQRAARMWPTIHEQTRRIYLDHELNKLGYVLMFDVLRNAAPYWILPDGLDSRTLRLQGRFLRNPRNSGVD